MIDYKYTKINLLNKVCNEMCYNFYYIYYGRIYNENKTKYRKFKYIECIDIFDVQEFFEKDSVTKADIKEYAEYLENSYLLNIKDYNDTKNLKEFYNYCNETIKHYNKIIGY